MTDIYDQHDKAFAQTSAWVVVKDGERVATVAIKHPRDGAGRLTAYVHWLGTEMVRGTASGGGYDKASAAIAQAAPKLFVDHHNLDSWNAFHAALANDNGQRWDRRLEDAGFTVWQAV